MQKIKKTLYLINPKERKKVILILFMVLIMAFLEMVGVASVMPFISVLVNPELVETNSILKRLFQMTNIIGIETRQQFLFFLGILCFFLLVASIVFKALTIYVQTTFNTTCRHNTAKRIMEGYLQQPYSWFLSRHSAELGKNILSEVKLVIDRGLGSMINLITQSTISIVLLTLLLFIDYKLTLIVGLSLGIVYFLIYKFSRSYTARIGQERLEANGLCFTALIEAFGAFKEVKVGGLEQVCVDRFSSPSHTLARHSASIDIIGKMPRLIIEAVVFGGIILIVLYLMLQSGSLVNALPIISLYAFASYRLMPALQGIYYSVTQIIFTSAAIDNMYDDLKSLNSYIPPQDLNSISLNKDIILKNINYQYPDASRTTLKNINISIPAKTTVGLVGVTGSGKTTTVDIILGLLEAQAGKLEVDGKEINKKNFRAWQRNIGYVPQQIYLADTTVSANIAFGADSKDIDYDAVERVAKIANIHDFIINELPSKYDTTVGERGVKLSGGQRQRIGIARALYHNPKLLILDEATSALDNLTEKSVMDEIHELGKDLTIVMIAHRLSTVKKCDKIFLLEDGMLKKQGTFNEIISINGEFQDTNTNL